MKIKPPHFDEWNFEYQSQAAEWFDGLPLGNGDLGALMLSSQQQIRFTLAKSDLWQDQCDDGTGKPGSFYPFDHFATLRSLIERRKWDEIETQFERKRAAWKGNFALLCAGALVLDTSRFEKEIELLDFRRRLDMGGASGTNSFTTRVRRQHVEALVSVEHEVLAIHVRCDLDWRKGNPPRKMDFGLDVRLEQPAPAQGGTVATRVRAGILSQIVRSAAGQHSIAVKVAGRDIRVTSDASRLTIRAGQRAEFKLFLALARGDDSARHAARRIHAAERAGYATIKRKHRQWWRKFWNASSISIPDDRMLRQYHFGLYLLASSSRRGYQMPGLQGLWYTRAPGAKWNEYTNDLNIQMNYWPVYASNHLELAWPYYDTVRRWLPEARRYTRNYWQCNGVQFSCCASPDGIVPAAYLTTMHWAGCAAFVAQNFWTHYLYSRDEEFLRDVAYPFLKECARFYLYFLKLDARGRYNIWPSNNPEAAEGSYEAWGKNVTMDIALLRMLFGAVVQSAEILGQNSDFAEACRRRIKHLPPYPMRDGALIDMESKEFLYSHRHNGMITPIYPCDDVSGKVAEKTIERFMRRGRCWWGGHTVPWQAAAYARIKRGREARDLLNEMFDSYFLPDGGFNLNYNYQRRVGGIIGPAVFCNESNSGFSAAVLEMLLQSHRGHIEVFPAVPEDWRDVEFTNLRAQGAFLVSARRSRSRITDVRVESTHGGTIRLQHPWPASPPRIYRGRNTVAVDIDRKGTLTWPTHAGSKYVLTSRGS